MVGRAQRWAELGTNITTTAMRFSSPWKYVHMCQLMQPTHSRPFVPHFVRRPATLALTYQNERSLDQVYVHEADGRAVRSQAAPCVCCPGTT